MERTAEDIPESYLAVFAAVMDKLNRGGSSAASVNMDEAIKEALRALSWLCSDQVREKKADEGEGPSSSSSWRALAERGKRLYIQSQMLPGTTETLAKLRTGLMGFGVLLMCSYEQVDRDEIPLPHRSQLVRRLNASAADLSAAGDDHDSDSAWQVASCYCCAEALQMLSTIDKEALSTMVGARDLEQLTEAAVAEFLRAAKILVLMQPLSNNMNPIVDNKSRYDAARIMIEKAALEVQSLDSWATVRFCESLLHSF